MAVEQGACLPTGTVTFLFTDIEGNTPLWERDPAAMQAALARHNTILEQAIQAQGGVVFEIIADEFNAVFTTAPQALRAALAAQGGLQATRWNELGPLRVRMGLHSGEAWLNPEGKYAISLTTTRTSRVMSAGYGGQVLLSQECADLCTRSLPEGVVLIDLGSHRLKGLAQPERLYQATAPGLPADFPTLRTLEICPNNLPLQLTSFIGREKESAEALRLLQHTRLLTLSGVGGTGKTRLALHLAGEALADFEHGAWLVELARLTDPAAVLPGVAAVFGFYEDRPSMPLATRLLYHLHDKKLLLILDNCEHLIGAAAQLVDQILHAASQVKVLATSREALGLAGETIYLTPSLDFPTLAAPELEPMPALAELSQFDAVRLFVERAQAVRPDFALSDSNARQVAQICQRLDGIPLAIELAAARMQAFSTGQICQRLDQRFRLLTGGSRTALPRQQTLRAAIDWSYRLLSEAERALLRRLAVFRGGWSLAAAEAVCGGAELGEEVFELLGRLVNKSLVEVEGGEGSDPRYRMLETVRQFAGELLDSEQFGREKPDESGEATQARNRHFDYYFGVSEAYYTEWLKGKGMGVYLPLAVELENIRSALDWAYGQGEARMALKGLKLVNNLMGAWAIFGLSGEGLAWTQRGLALAGDPEGEALPIRARALLCAAWNCSSLDRNRDMCLYMRESARLSRRYDDAYELGSALVGCSWCAGVLEPSHPCAVSAEESKALFQEGERLLRQSGVRQGLIQIYNLGISQAIADHEFEKARSLMEEFYPFCPDDPSRDGAMEEFRGDIANGEKNYNQAIEHYKRAAEYFQLINLRSLIALNFQNAGALLIDQKAYDQARTYLQQSMHLAQEIGAQWQFTTSVRKLVEIALLEKDYPQVGAYLRRGLALAPEVDPEILVGNILLPLLQAAEQTAQGQTMAQILGFIENQVEILTRSTRVKSEHERLASALQQQMGAEAFQAEYTRGRGLTVEGLLSEARRLAEAVEQAG